MAVTPTGVPQLSSPMVMPNGAVTQPWYLFFTNLWVRTGGGGGTNVAPANADYIIFGANPELSNARLATSSASAVWDFTVPSEARINVEFSAITISESQVIGLTSDLAARVLITTHVTPGTGLSGGGPLSGSVTLNIAANGVTNALLAQMPTLTIKGNNTGGTTNALDLTVAQVNAILPVFTNTLNGLVPLSGGGTTNYLRADATFDNPLAGGVSGTVTLAALTTLGTQGSLTVVNGLITAIINPT